MEVNFKEKLFSLDSRNKRCNDCGDENVKYVSVNNGITLCELCAQIHKNFGNQISYIRSLDEPFDDFLISFFIYGGNRKFRKTLKQMGVNLDVKKGQLYRTYGVDFYRRNLKSISKGNSQLDKDYENPNEVMKIASNSFPEFENYIIKSSFDPTQIIEGNVLTKNNMNELNDLNLGIDLNYNDLGGGNVINDPIENNGFNNYDLNNNDIELNPEKKIESVQNEPAPEPEKNPEGGQGVPQKKVSVEGDDDEDSVERRVKKLMKLSVKGAKVLGKFMKKSGIKGYGLAKKYGKITYKNTTNYVKEHVPYLNKNKDNKEKNNGKDNQ